MKKLSFLWAFAAVGALMTSCSSEEAVMPEKQDNKSASVKTDVSLQEAREDLESLLSDLNEAETRSGESTRKIIAESYTSTLKGSGTRSSDQNQIPIHVFNFENNQGYAVMSGDSRYPSLIALAEEGSYDEEEIMSNPGTDIYYGNLGDVIIIGPKNPNPPNPGWVGSTEYPVYGEWSNTIYSPNGTCKVKWGQQSPFNNYCPLINGTRALTGCVATAMAQIMAVHKYPASYDGYSFNWDSMTAGSRYWNVTNSAQDNIARLMERLGLGKNLDMNYGTYASGANQKNCRRTFQSFGYSSPGTLGDYTTESVIPDLKAGYPIMIIGYAQEKSDGHAWIGHGLLMRSRTVKMYDSNTNQFKYSKTETQYYVLCNWGWSGSSDGYYLSKVFDTKTGAIYNDNGTPNTSGGNSNYNFKYKQQAITGIRK